MISPCGIELSHFVENSHRKNQRESCHLKRGDALVFTCGCDLIGLCVAGKILDKHLRLMRWNQ